MLALLETLKTSKQQGDDCQAALHILEQRLRRFRSLMHKMDPEQHRDEKAIFNAALYAIFNAIEDFRGRTEREAIAFCRTIVRRTTIRHLRAVTWPTERTEILEAIPAPGPTSEESLLRKKDTSWCTKHWRCSGLKNGYGSSELYYMGNGSWTSPSVAGRQKTP